MPARDFLTEMRHIVQQNSLRTNSRRLFLRIAVRAVLGLLGHRLSASLADGEFSAARLTERRLLFSRPVAVRAFAFVLLRLLRHNYTPYPS